MPRPLRIEYEDAWYHVMNRGANQKTIFRNDTQRQLFLLLLEETSNLFSIEVHAYCLMGNHYHLLIKTPLGNLGRAMRHINGLYTQRFNKLEKRDGPLFRGRYKAVLVEVDNYLLQVSRYIHLNPVTAKLCVHPLDYAWSSYPAYIGQAKPTTKLHTDFILSLMPNPRQIDKYREFVNQGVDKDLMNFYNKARLCPILGSKDFIAEKLKRIGVNHKQDCSTDIRRTHSRTEVEAVFKKLTTYFKIPKSALLNPTRGELNEGRLMGIYLAKQLCQLTHAEIANHFTHLTISGVGAAIRRCKHLLENDRLFKKAFDEINLKLL